MPKQIVKYLCDFKCGHKAFHRKRDAEKHESNCVLNPATKSCATCSNQIYSRDSDDFRSWYNRECKIKVLNDFIEELHDKLVIKSGVSHVRPLVGCPNWNETNESPSTTFFINDIRPKIEQAYMLRELAIKQTLDIPF